MATSSLYLLFHSCAALILEPDLPAPPSLCTGVVYGLGGEAAGVQHVRSAPLQAQSGSRRLVRPLQGAAQPGQLPRREVTPSPK